MTVRTLLSLAFVAAISSLATGKQCYRCGYQKEGDGPAMALPGMPECGDSANMESNKVDCTAEGDECCGSIREYLEIVDNDNGEKRELTIGRHDCEQDLANYANYGVLCSDHTDACEDIDLDHLPEGHNETISRAKVCFCSGDLCNFNVPDLGTTTPSADTTKAGKQCYNCGYRKTPSGELEALPDLAECNDFATPDDITKTCSNDGDCCASLKEYFTTIDETTGENSTVIIGRHGCETDLAHIGEQTVLCSEHTDQCVNIEHASLPDHQDNNVTVSDIEICFCSGDRCNADDPIPPEPTSGDTTPSADTTKAGKQCYNCGHRTLPSGEQEALPDLAFCNDFATPDDITTTCSNDGDCCASLEEYFTTIDETTGENSTVIIGRHGCETDLSHIGEQTVLCSEHTDECVNIEHASLPDHQDNNVTVTDIEICFCSGDRCNADDPLPPVPTTTTTTTATGTAGAVVSSIAMLTISFFVLN